jgi:hypothetical protein
VLVAYALTRVALAVALVLCHIVPPRGGWRLPATPLLHTDVAPLLLILMLGVTQVRGVAWLVTFVCWGCAIACIRAAAGATSLLHTDIALLLLILVLGVTQVGLPKRP